MGYLELTTWQTTTEKGRGYKKAVIDSLKQQNVGHAAIKLVLPVNDETTKLVMEISQKTALPWFIVNHSVSEGEVSYSGDSMKVIPKDKKNVHTQSDYHIYFSFWPSKKDDEKYALCGPIQDYKSEQLGRDFFGKNRRRDLLESQYIKRQEVKKKGEVTRVYLLSPNVTHLAQKGVLTEKEKQLDDMKEGLYSIVENLSEINNALQNMDDINEEQLAFFQDEHNLSEIIGRLHAFFPDLNIPGKLNLDKLREKLAKKAPSETDILLEVSLLVEQLYSLDKLIERAETSLPYYAQVYYDTQGDHGDHSVTVPVVLPKEKSDQASCALDAKKMIATLHSIISSEVGYTIDGYNCSTAVGEVISAGIPDAKQKSDFEALLRSKYLPATPQGALRATQHLSVELGKNRLQSIPKSSSKSENLITQSITIVADDLARQVREKTVVITKLDFMKEKEKSKTLKAKNIEDLIEHIELVRDNENKIPIIDDKLKIEIEKIKIGHEKRLSKLTGEPKSKKDIEAKEFLGNYHKLQLANQQTLKFATNKQEKLRAKRMAERKERKKREMELNAQADKLQNPQAEKREEKRPALILTSSGKGQEHSMQSGKDSSEEDLSINTSRPVAKKRPE